MRILLSLAAALLAAVPAAAAVDRAEIWLDAAKTATPGEVRLEWSGGRTSFAVFRSVSAQETATAQARVGDTVEPLWIDPAPLEPLLFYMVLDLCGNGILDPGEVCDDGNVSLLDGCNAECNLESCGNGQVDPGEECDDGNLASGDGCSAQCRGIVSDDFSPFADAGWSFVDPLGGANHALRGAGTADAHVVLSVPEGATHDAWIVNRAPRLMQAADDADFEIELKLESPLSQGSQLVGLIVEQDAQRWIRFDAYSDGSNWALFAATMQAGSGRARHNVVQGSGPSPVPLWLRVLREGDHFSQTWSADPGLGWNAGAEFDFALQVRSVGLFAGNYSPSGVDAPALEAALDYFFETGAPVVPEDPVSCGNGLPDPGEECDDGNAIEGDGCSPLCELDPFCGDGQLDPGEECDDGNDLDGDGCQAGCLEPVCGDDIVDPGEDCDDGPGNGDAPDYACRTDCTARRCGDGVIDADELCDDGNNLDGDGCSASCERFVSDDFSPALEAVWSFIDPNGDSAWAMRGAGTEDAHLVFSLPGGASHDAWVDNRSARMLQAADDGDFEIVLKLEAPLSRGYQLQGLLVEQDAQTWVRFDVYSDGAGWYLFAATMTGGRGTARCNQRLGDGPSPVPLWLRVQRAAGQWAVSWSVAPESEGWSEPHTFTFAMQVRSVGPFAGNHSLSGQDAPGFEAAFDYVFDAATPVVPEDPVTCGNDVVDPGEECDDGNRTDGDGCQGDCTDPRCGDGILDPGEECDDGNLVDADGCQADCADPVCGDGVLDPGEQCDDGNLVNGDGCQAGCATPFCGDGILDPGEECDDGPANSDAPDAACRSDCLPARCGDGTLDGGESCDDGNSAPGDGCDASCAFECGNAEVDAGEDCDAGQANADLPDAPCRSDCTLPRCGDGVLDSGERCDDGNALDGDGCSAACAGLVSDDFSPGLDAGWVWTDPSGDATHTIRGAGTEDAWLVLSVPSGPSHDAWVTNQAPRMMQPIDDADFEIELKLESSLNAGNQLQGLIVEQDASTWIRFDLYSDGAAWYAFAATMSAGAGTARCNVELGQGASPTPLWLRVRRTGDQWRLSYSVDPPGQGFDELAVFPFALQVRNVGPFAGNHAPAGVDAPTLTAAFDYLFDTTAPVVPEDPVTCGNGLVDPGEACDDGNGVDEDGCHVDCTEPECGDGILDPGEACDDGNGADGDGCSSTCEWEPFCGNARPDPGEQCDEGGANSDAPDAFCRTDCSLARCGDGILDGDEQCDDGNGSGQDGCTPDCRVELEYCGNAAVDPGEDCDDGNHLDGDGCSAACATLLSDDFSPFLNDGWSFVDPGGDAEGFVRGAGTADSRLHIVVPAGSLHDAWGVNGAPRLMQAVDDADFEVELKIETSLSEGNQFQGLIVEQDAATWIRFDVYADGIGWNLFAATIDEGDPAAPINLALGVGASPAPLWLRVVRAGDQWTLRWSVDPQAGWNDAGEFAFALQVRALGPFGGNFSDLPDQAPALEAIFDYLFETGTAVVPEDPVTCGNGTTDPGEECDDGNLQDGDGCSLICENEPYCGDGAVDPGETCDAGAANSDAPGAPCRSDCTAAGCGDGILDPGEACDEAGANSDAPGATCRSDCLAGRCGDGIVDPGETCDDGNNVDADGCQAHCALPFCGDGILDPGEACDDGNDQPFDGCRADCTEESCGDGILDPDEDCDDGNLVGGDGCSLLCATIRSDDFSPGLNPGWSFVDPLGDADTSLSGAGSADAVFSIQVPGGVAHDAAVDNLAPRLMQGADDVDFEIEVKLQGTLGAGRQIQGLVVEQDADDWMRFDASSDGASWFVSAAVVIGGSPGLPIHEMVGVGGSPDPLWLRVTRVGDIWTYAYSPDPLNDGWTVADTFEQALVVRAVGLFAGNASIAGGDPPALTAVFDYFFETAVPVVPEDPLD